VNSKGFTIKGALTFVERRFGAEGKAKVIAALDPDSRKIAERLVLSSEWVPFRTQVALYEAIDRTLGRGDLALCWEIGRFTSEHEMNTVNLIFLKLGKLEHWFRAASLMWGRYYSEGSLEVEEFTKGKGTILIKNFNPLSHAFCRDFSGWLQRTVELSGLAKVTIKHPRCVLSGGDVCAFEGSWDER
jgi:hypothetical protein